MQVVYRPTGQLGDIPDDKFDPSLFSMPDGSSQPPATPPNDPEAQAKQGMLANIATGMVKPFVGTGEDILGGTFEGVRALKSALGDKNAYVSQQTGQEVQNPFLSDQKMKDIHDHPIKHDLQNEAQVATWAIPFGQGGSALTRAWAPGALSGAVNALGQDNATPVSVVGGALMGAGTAGLMDKFLGGAARAEAAQNAAQGIQPAAEDVTQQTGNNLGDSFIGSQYSVNKSDLKAAGVNNLQDLIEKIKNETGLTDTGDIQKVIDSLSGKEGTLNQINMQALGDAAPIKTDGILDAFTKAVKKPGISPTTQDQLLQYAKDSLGDISENGMADPTKTMGLIRELEGYSNELSSGVPTTEDKLMKGAYGALHDELTSRLFTTPLNQDLLDKLSNGTLDANGAAELLNNPQIQKAYESATSGKYGDVVQKNLDSAIQNGDYRGYLTPLENYLPQDLKLQLHPAILGADGAPAGAAAASSMEKAVKPILSQTPLIPGVNLPLSDADLIAKATGQQLGAGEVSVNRYLTPEVMAQIKQANPQIAQTIQDKIDNGGVTIGDLRALQAPLVQEDKLLNLSDRNEFLRQAGGNTQTRGLGKITNMIDLQNPLKILNPALSSKGLNARVGGMLDNVGDLPNNFVQGVSKKVSAVPLLNKIIPQVRPMLPNAVIRAIGNAGGTNNTVASPLQMGQNDTMAQPYTPQQPASSTSQPFSAQNATQGGQNRGGSQGGTLPDVGQLITPDQATQLMISDLQETGGKNIAALKSIYDMSNSGAGAQKPNASLQAQMAQVSQAQADLGQLTTMLNQGVGLTGPGLGNITQLTEPFNKNAASFSAARDTAAQSIARALSPDTNRITPAQLEAAKKLLPDITDGPGNMQAKLAALQQQINNKKQVLLMYPQANASSLQDLGAVSSLVSDQ